MNKDLIQVVFHGCVRRNDMHREDYDRYFSETLTRVPKGITFSEWVLGCFDRSAVLGKVSIKGKALPEDQWDTHIMQDGDYVLASSLLWLHQEGMDLPPLRRPAWTPVIEIF